MVARTIQSNSLFSLIVGPMVWAAHFLVVYVTTAIACAKDFFNHQVWGIDLVPFTVGIATLIAAVLIVDGIALSYRRWRGPPGARAEMPPHDRSDKQSRYRFMAYAGLLLSGLSLVAILWVALPVLLIDSCR